MAGVIAETQISDSGLSDPPSADYESEIWRPIPGSDGFYSVSSLGRIRSEPIQTSRKGRQRGRVLKLCPDTKGYLQFRMSLPGRKVTLKAHCAVALAFLGPRPPGQQINHINGNKRDNTVTNLEYISCLRNVRHSWKTGLCSVDHRQGERSAVAKLTSDDVRRIRRMRAQHGPTELARRFGVTRQCIHHIVTGRTWKHVA